MLQLSQLKAPHDACIIHAQTYNTDLAQDLARMTTTTRTTTMNRPSPASRSLIDHVGCAVCNCAHKTAKRSTFNMMKIEIELPKLTDFRIPSNVLRLLQFVSRLRFNLTRKGLVHSILFCAQGLRLWDTTQWQRTRCEFRGGQREGGRVVDLVYNFVFTVRFVYAMDESPFVLHTQSKGWGWGRGTVCQGVRVNARNCKVRPFIQATSRRKPPIAIHAHLHTHSNTHIHTHSPTYILKHTGPSMHHM